MASPYPRAGSDQDSKDQDGVMATVNRACYATREDVRRAMETPMAAYDDDRIDRAILAATEAVEGLTQRRFYTELSTRKWDWPNWQYAPPWKVYLDENELAGEPTLFQSGALGSDPVTFAPGEYILHPVNTGPPFNRIELRRDLSGSFGNGPGPQLDISVTGPFGYWDVMSPAGTAAVQCDIVADTITVSDSSKVGVGDVLICGSERMIVTESTYLNTNIAFSGLSESKAGDKAVDVADGTKFRAGEVLLVDLEWILIEAVVGNRLIVKRAWDGSMLAEHGSGTLWVRRVFSVLRGQLGTQAAIHAPGAALSVAAIPGLVRELTIAEAIVWLAQETGGYAGGGGSGAAGLPVSGPGLAGLRDRVFQSRFCRKARSRAVLCLLTSLCPGRSLTAGLMPRPMPSAG